MAAAAVMQKSGLLIFQKRVDKIKGVCYYLTVTNL